MKVRVLKLEDRPAVEALMDDFGDEIAGMDPQNRVRREPGYGAELTRQMVEDAERSTGLVLVAEDEGQVVGFASGVIRTRDERDRLAVVDFRNGVVAELYVAPAWRARGIGRTLVARLQQHFVDRGCGAMRVEVFAPNRGARAFYERLAFEERDLWLFKRL
jgi:ribosomal protein S18 acetylase RimI-like enzyme